MVKRQLLFVTYLDEHLDEGVSYAIELAKAMLEDIVLLLVRKRDTLSEQLSDLMAASAFAEEGEHEIADRIARGSERYQPEVINNMITELIVASSKAGVHLEIQKTDRDVISGVRSFLKGNTAIDKVVLSPAVTESEALTTRDLNRLVRTASRPIVTMTKQSVRAMQEAERNMPYRYEPSTSY
jgi:hypothetical protein